MGVDVLLEGPSPLLVRAVTAPAGLVRCHVGQSALLERGRLRMRGHPLGPCRALGFKWIAALNTQPLGVLCLGAGLLKGHVVATAKAHMMLLVANAVAKKPRAGAAGSDLQIGAVANCVA